MYLLLKGKMDLSREHAKITPYTYNLYIHIYNILPLQNVKINVNI